MTLCDHNEADENRMELIPRDTNTTASEKERSFHGWMASHHSLLIHILMGFFFSKFFCPPKIRQRFYQAKEFIVLLASSKMDKFSTAPPSLKEMFL